MLFQLCSELMYQTELLDRKSKQENNWCFSLSMSKMFTRLDTENLEVAKKYFVDANGCHFLYTYFNRTLPNDERV